MGAGAPHNLSTTFPSQKTSGKVGEVPRHGCKPVVDETTKATVIMGTDGSLNGVR